ncbi:hypothetical protein PVAG01_09075 [Phlyctema vagabunda]|uniref:Uncharacterized protein n=1 Tax=Phlyctema vagabunda TaxID=108571 RepID=A0ABR4P6B3_9HELO
MGLSRSRSITIVVALTTLTTNALSLLLCYQLPDDPYHVAYKFGGYLHFANILSVFGLIGALRQHALSITIFSNYLILDTTLSSIPRFLLLVLLHGMTADFCAQPNQPITSQYISAATSPLVSRSSFTPSPSLSSYSIQACTRIVVLAQLTLLAGVVAGTLLQFVGALQVRDYARGLWLKESLEDEECSVIIIREGPGRDLPIIYEDVVGEAIDRKV